jgi:putative glycosyltransferase (TIGR04372 family)
VREAGFLREPPTSGHRHLNADVRTYLPAVEWLVEQGATVVRMGDPSMQELPAANGLFDYAHSDLKSDWMDVYLAAECRFWLGTNSGLFMLASSFGVPVALTNVAPAIFRPWSSGDLFIPKLYFSPERGRLLTLAESLAPELYTSHDIDTQGVRPVDNEPEEILALTREMVERLEGHRAASPAEEELQERFRRIQPSYYPVPMLCRIGSDFLARHEELLDV